MAGQHTLSPVPVLVARATKTPGEVSVSREDLADLSTLFDPPKNTVQGRTIRAIDLFTAQPGQLPKVGYLIEGLVVDRGLWMLAAMPKRGKSLLRRLVAVCSKSVRSV